MVPPEGIEPPSSACKTAALPLDERGMVGVDGFEPSASRFRTAHSARLSYTPWYDRDYSQVVVAARGLEPLPERL